MDNLTMLRNLMVMAAADEKFTEEEIMLLALRSSRWGISDAQFDEALRYATSNHPEVALPKEPKEQERLLKNLLEVMAADGELAEVEKKLFANAAAKMNWSGERVGKMLDEMIQQ